MDRDHALGSAGVLVRVRVLRPHLLLTMRVGTPVHWALMKSPPGPPFRSGSLWEGGYHCLAWGTVLRIIALPQQCVQVEKGLPMEPTCSLETPISVTFQAAARKECSRFLFSLPNLWMLISLARVDACSYREHIRTFNSQNIQSEWTLAVNNQHYHAMKRAGCK